MSIYRSSYGAGSIENTTSRTSLRTRKSISAFILVTEPVSSGIHTLKAFTDHCIEQLRQAAMCHGDVSLTTFFWDPTKSLPVFSPKRAPHTCIDWEQLASFANDRSVALDELERLRNPLMSGVGR